MDDHLHRELEKIQQDEEEEYLTPKITSEVGQNTSSPDVINGKSDKKKEIFSLGYKKSFKKYYPCTFVGCGKKYIKSSHLKVKWVKYIYFD